MESKEVWKIKKRKDKPSNRKLIGNRWVYKKKDNGTYRACTVAKGYDQVPGKDFQENHAPVVKDTTFRITLILKILLKLESEHFDVETAFLYGDLDKEIWMEFSEGYVNYLKKIMMTQSGVWNSERPYTVWYKLHDSGERSSKKPCENWDLSQVWQILASSIGRKETSGHS
jgi:hypothetical protein